MFDTVFLRFFAILLVTNSHLDRLYPIQGFASGGSLGNSLFFLVSGLGLALSHDRGLSRSFFSWFLHRCSKIYPSIWLAVIIFSFVLSSSGQEWHFQDYLHHLIYPTSYWFISALLLFYILAYPILHLKNRNLTLWLMLSLILPYFYFYFTAMDLNHFSIENKSFFKWIFYFAMMLFGIWLAPIYKGWKENPEKTNVFDFILLFIILAIYLVLKLFIAAGTLTHWQFLVQWVTFPFVYYCLRCVQHHRIEVFLRQGKWAKLIKIVASATLEIYLLQQYIYTLPLITHLPYPWNIGLFWALVITMAVLLHEISGKLTAKLKGPQL